MLIHIEKGTNAALRVRDAANLFLSIPVIYKLFGM